MAIQYYKIQSTGESYALDKATGKVEKISAIPAGGATITWTGTGLPGEISNALAEQARLEAIRKENVIAPTPTTVASLTDITQQVSGSVAFKNTDAYKSLTADQKEFVDMAYNLITVGGEAEAKLFANAIAQAKAVADPYFKAMLILAEAEVRGAVAQQNFDYETQKEILERANRELQEDIILNKDYLSFEEQAEIARQTRGYKGDLLTIADVAAEKGLTFGAGYRSRTEAERLRGEQYEDVIQSSTRQYNLQIKELQYKASRGDLGAQRKLETLKGTRTLALQKIGRSAEELMGTSAISGLVEEYTPVGSIMGTIEEQKKKAIGSDIGAFVNLQKGFL